MNTTDIRKILRDLYGARQYRITAAGEIHIYGRLTANLYGWRYFGALGDILTEQRLLYLSGADYR